MSSNLPQTIKRRSSRPTVGDPGTKKAKTTESAPAENAHKHTRKTLKDSDKQQEASKPLATLGRNKSDKQKTNTEPEEAETNVSEPSEPYISIKNPATDIQPEVLRRCVEKMLICDEEYLVVGSQSLECITNAEYVKQPEILEKLKYASIIFLLLLQEHWKVAIINVGGDAITVEFYDPVPSDLSTQAARQVIDKFFEQYFAGKDYSLTYLFEQMSTPNHHDDHDSMVIAFFVCINCLSEHPMPLQIDLVLWRHIMATIAGEKPDWKKISPIPRETSQVLSNIPKLAANPTLKDYITWKTAFDDWHENQRVTLTSQAAIGNLECRGRIPKAMRAFSILCSVKDEMEKRLQCGSDAVCRQPKDILELKASIAIVEKTYELVDDVAIELEKGAKACLEEMKMLSQ